MSYSEEYLCRLYEKYMEINKKGTDLISSFVLKEFKNPKAQEYARHGFCRRIRLMMRCIEQVFEDLPPENKNVPDSDTVRDAAIFLQAFMFNTFGCIDNLAHIWVIEKEVKNKFGKELRPSQVGLGPDKTVVLKSLPRRFSDYLGEIRPWFQYLQNFRHALAHRIPLYIPPSLITNDKLEEYQATEVRIREATSRSDYFEAEQLEEKQNALTSFLPVTTHSFSEGSRPVYFHAQMLVDFETVEGIGVRFLREFD